MLENILSARNNLFSQITNIYLLLKTKDNINQYHHICHAYAAKPYVLGEMLSAEKLGR